MQAWEAALELRNELAEWWATPAGKQFGSGWTKSRVTGNPLPPIEQIEPWKLAIASPFFVTEEMVELLHAAGKTFPPTEFRREDLPLDSGFVLLAKPLQFNDIHGKEYNWRVFAWSLVGHGASPEDVSGIHFSTYAHRDDPDPEWAQLDAEAAERGIPYRFGTLSLLHESIWTFDHDYTGLANWKGGTIANQDEPVTQESVAGSIEALQQMHAFFLLSWQRIADPQPTQASRPVRKRTARLFPERPVPDVRVVTLRRYREDDPEHVADETGRHYSHRWIVNGFWRRQWYPSESRHKPKWIAPYVKGPKDAPLITKETTYLWRR